MNNYNELRKQVRDAFVDDEKSGMFPTVDWVMNYLIAQGRIVPDGYVAVPKSHLEECKQSFVQSRIPGFSVENWMLNAEMCVDAMIAAAQKGDERCCQKFVVL